MIVSTECDKCNADTSYALYQDIIFHDTKNLNERTNVIVCLNSEAPLLPR